ncbi:MAG TPA: NAD(P)/FAD-dependent oxidoreductase [Stellaceae bacterium]|nr:NAD(P)/FAD-dependent oxidoreductase [Stellaceae bacterium]
MNAQTASAQPERPAIASTGKGAALPDRVRVVIVGGGFAGIEAARALQRSPARVTVIDCRNYSLFQPLLYQVATAALSPADVAVPIRSLLRGANTEVVLDEVVGVELDSARVRTRAGRAIGFDFLVLASGSQYNYFGHDEWISFAPGPKTLEDAVTIRRRLLLAFEEAEISGGDEERRALMTFVIVGGGPTGVEMAGAVAELARATLVRDFRHIDPALAHILLIEAGPRLLGAFPEKLGLYARRALTRLGVEVLLDTEVEHIDATGVLAGGRRIAARSVIWGAGVEATPAAPWLGVRPDRHGEVDVNPDFSIVGHPNVFVVGDAARALGSDGKPLPGLAAVAKQEGRYVGRLLRCRIAGKGVMPLFRYHDYGMMATIGRSAAVADLRGFRFTGRLAWLLWGAVHIYFLIGFRNRLVVLVNWLWIWLVYARGARLITDYEPSRPVPQPRPASPPPRRTRPSRRAQSAAARRDRNGQRTL